MCNLKLKIVTVLLSIIYVLSMIPAVSSLAATITSGMCGENIIWSLDDLGTLTLSGSGDMENYDSAYSTPWCDYRDNIKSVVLSKSITSIGDRAFGLCTNLNTATIPNSVTRIGTNTFEGCDSIFEIEYDGSRDQWNSIGGDSLGIPYESVSCVTDVTLPQDATGYAGDEATFSVIAKGTGVKYQWQSNSSGTWVNSSLPGSKTATLLVPITNSRDRYKFRCVVTDSIGRTATSEYATLYLVDIQSRRCGDNLTWTFDNTGTLKISGSGGMDYWDSETYTLIPWYSYRDVIKSVVFSGEITSISPYAFADCTNLTSVVMPNSINQICTATFSGCTNLININIPNNVSEIQSKAFYSCSSLSDIIIPYGVTSIGYNAFAECTKLASVNIPESVTSIENDAFYNCGLTSVIIPSSVSSIGDGAFYGCKITKATIKNGVSSIGEGSFAQCKELKTVSVPNSVTSIGSGAFSGCQSLTSFTIPSYVHSINAQTFAYCTNLTGVTIPDGIISIGTEAFCQCKSLKTITVPDGVTSIGANAFSGCSSLTSFTIPSLITAIDTETFAYCTNLTRVSIPEGLSYIGPHAFCDCSSLESVYIPNSVTTIDDMAFFGCGFTRLDIPNSIKSIGDGAFGYCTELICINIPDNVNYIGESAFGGCKSLSSISIPDGITSIGSGTFSGCTSLTSIIIPDSVTQIGNQAFEYSGLTSIVIPDSVTSIGDSCFSLCTNLTSVKLPEKITKIGNGTFYSCSSLKEVTIPDSVTTIDSSAFVYCTKISSIEIPESVTVIGNGAFFGCTNLTNINIPSGISTISAYTFYQCHSLTTVSIPESVKTIESYVFYGDDNLRDVYYGSTIDHFELIRYIDEDGNETCLDKDYVFGNAVIHFSDVPLNITKNPDDFSDYAGNTATFKVVAQGEGLIYQWQTYSSGIWKNSSFPGSKSSELSVPIQNSRDGYKFRCVVKDSNKQKITSNTATLHVIAPVSLTGQPSDYTGTVGGTATFKVTASGTGLKYQWQAYSNGKWVNSSFTGAKTATLSVPVTASRDGYKYRCIVTDAGNNTVTSNSVTLHVVAPVSLTGQPSDYTGTVGGTATFKVTASGIGLKYQWQAYSNGKWVNSSFTGAKTATLSVPVTAARDGYKFRCVITDAIGNKVISNTVVLHAITPVEITTQPKDYTGAVGSTATFTVKATGTDLKYQWQAYSNGKWVNSSFTGAKTATLSVPVTAARDGYKFRCVVTDKYNQTATSNSAVLHVAAPIAITTQPKDYTGVVGSTAEFKVKATGTDLKYQWQSYKNGKWVNSSFPGYNTATLSVGVTASRDGYQFRCVVTDKYNQTVTSNTAILHVATPATITSQPKDFTGPVGSTAEFKVKATGTGLKYRWQIYKSGAWKNSSFTGSTTATLSVDVTASRDGYKFRCVITDSLGNTVTSKTATLHVDNTHTSATNVVTVTTPSNLGLIDSEDEQAIPEPEETEKIIFDTEDTIESVTTDVTEETEEAAVAEPEPVENTEALDATEDDYTGLTGNADEIDDALTYVDNEADTVDSVSAS